MIKTISVKHYHEFITDDNQFIKTEPIEITFFINKEGEYYLPMHNHNIVEGFVYRGNSTRSTFEDGVFKIDDHNHIIKYKDKEYLNLKTFYEVSMKYGDYIV